MADNTKIEWTDSTWNPITGCSVVSPGCTNCYAMRLAGTRMKHHPTRKGLTEDSKAGPVWNGKVRFNEKWIDQPLRWAEPRRIFVCAHGDLFHESVPDVWIDEVFARMALASHHVFQVLTKRPERMRDYVNQKSALGRIWYLAQKARSTIPNWISGACLDAWPLPHVWLGVSVEDQARADERILVLLETPAAVRFVSAEPLLGPLQFYALCDGHKFIDALKGTWWHDAPQGYRSAVSHGHEKLDWVIIGGESGPNARPFDLDWARPLLAGCRAAGVACFVKQLGSATGYNLHDRKGGDINEWPEDIKVREFPNV